MIELICDSWVTQKFAGLIHKARGNLTSFRNDSGTSLPIFVAVNGKKCAKGAIEIEFMSK